MGGCLVRIQTCDWKFTNIGQTLSWILESDAAGVDPSGSALIYVNLIGFAVALIIASPVFFKLNAFKDKEYDDYVGYVDDTSEKSKASFWVHVHTILDFHAFFTTR